jgi:site-specific recombinase XerD
MAKSKHKRTAKTVLKLPDLEQSKSAVMNSLTSASSKRSYDHAIREFIDWYCSEPRLAFNRTVVTRYRIALEQHPYAPSTINLRLAAIRRLAYEASDCGLLSPDLAAGIRRVKGVRRLGVRVGNWLTAEEGKKLLSINKAGRISGDGFTPKVIWAIVKANAKSCGLATIAPHDLRRTCARLCHQAGGELEQIQFLLGHVSVQTTERYLGCKQRFRDAVNDHIGLEPHASS